MFYIYDKKTGKFKNYKSANRPAQDEGCTDIALPKYDRNFQEVFFNEENNSWQIIEKPIENQLLIKKSALQKQLKEAYKNTRKLHIQNGYDFVIDFSSDDGKMFLEIVKTASLEIEEFNKDSILHIHQFFITVEATKDNKTTTKNIQIRMANWFWKYIFEETLTYTASQKQLCEKYKNDIEIAETLEDIENVKIVFPNANGLTINVNTTIEKLVKVAMGLEEDEYLDEDGKKQKLKMPKKVVDYLLKTAEDPESLFQETDAENVKKNIGFTLENSFFN